MFTITAHPASDRSHQIKQTASSVSLLEAWTRAFQYSGWTIRTTEYSDYDVTDLYICSACQWRGNYTTELDDKFLCPACDSVVRVRADYQNGAV